MYPKCTQNFNEHIRVYNIHPPLDVHIWLAGNLTNQNQKLLTYGAGGGVNQKQTIAEFCTCSFPFSDAVLIVFLYTYLTRTLSLFIHKASKNRT